MAATMGAYAEEKAADAKTMVISATPQAMYVFIDKDKDGNVTVTELQTYFVEWFKKADKNNDGKITPEEIEAQTATVFKCADLNGDGILTLEETLTYHAGKDVKVGDAKLNVDGKNAFEKHDADNDGKISSVEYAAFWTDLHGKMDADKDGKVTVEENKQQIARWFKAMDTDNDGAVACEEMMKAQVGSAACAACPVAEKKAGCCSMSEKPAPDKAAEKKVETPAEK